MIQVLHDVGGKFKKLEERLERLRIADIEEQLRLAGIDSSRLLTEIHSLTEKVKEALENIEEEE